MAARGSASAGHGAGDSLGSAYPPQVLEVPGIPPGRQPEADGGRLIRDHGQ